MSLLSKLKDLTSITHRTRSEKLTYFKSLVYNKYVNGRWYIKEYNNVIDQHALVSTGGDYKCGARYYKSSSIYYTRIYYWRPATYHSNQKASIDFKNGSSTRITSNQSLSSSYVNVYSTSTLANANAGTITVTIPAYHDTTNNVYYTGVKYSITVSNLTTSTVYYDIVYEDV